MWLTRMQDSEPEVATLVVHVLTKSTFETVTPDVVHAASASSLQMSCKARVSSSTTWEGLLLASREVEQLELARTEAVRCVPDVD